jgi:hypothetical protein
LAEQVKTNGQGRRIGDSHPRAVLTDHDVDLLMRLLDDREALLGRMQFDGAPRAEIDKALHDKGLSYRKLAEKFEVHKTCIQKIANGERRCQGAYP